MFYIAFHKRNQASLYEIDTAWPVRLINQASEYLQAIDEADYLDYVKQKRAQKRQQNAARGRKR